MQKHSRLDLSIIFPHKVANQREKSEGNFVNSIHESIYNNTFCCKIFIDFGGFVFGWIECILSDFNWISLSYTLPVAINHTEGTISRQTKIINFQSGGFYSVTFFLFGK